MKYLNTKMLPLRSSQFKSRKLNIYMEIRCEHDNGKLVLLTQISKQEDHSYLLNIISSFKSITIIGRSLKELVWYFSLEQRIFD